MSTKTIEIRSALSGDQDKLCDILRATYINTMASIVPPAALTTFYQQDNPREFVDKCWQDFYVAVVGDELAGLLFIDNNKVESLHIHPDSSRTGCGKKLLRFAEEKISANCSYAQLEVLVGNINARSFYQSQGWVDIKEFVGLELGGTPAAMVLMRKEL